MHVKMSEQYILYHIQGFQYFSRVQVLHYLQAVLFIRWVKVSGTALIDY